MVYPNYPEEQIDDNARLYKRVYKDFFKNGKLSPSVFKEIGSGNEQSMSTDWEKYSTPIESRMRAKRPECNGIFHFISGNLRRLMLRVRHAPLIENRAHTDVNGTTRPIQEDTELRLKLLDEITWDIYPDEPLESK